MVASCPGVGKTYRPHLQRSSPRHLEMEMTCPETSVKNYPPTLRKIRKEPISRNFPLSGHQEWRFNRIESLHYTGHRGTSVVLRTAIKRDVMYFRFQEPTGIRHIYARDSPLTIPNKILLYKLFSRSMIKYAAPVWSSTSLTNYRHLQVYQSKCLRVLGDFPWRTPRSNLHAHLQIIPMR